MSEFTADQRAAIKDIVEEVLDEAYALPATTEEIGLLRDMALEAMTRRMPNHSNTPKASVYLLYEGAAAAWANLIPVTDRVRRRLAAWLELDREEPMRPPADPKAYLPLTTSDGTRPHPERFPRGANLDAPIPKETWPCIQDAEAAKGSK